MTVMRDHGRNVARLRMHRQVCDTDVLNGDRFACVGRVDVILSARDEEKEKRSG